MGFDKFINLQLLERFYTNLKVYINNLLQGKQDILVSGTNIKTVNGESLLGEGDIKSLVEITYSELVTLKSNKTLKPGTFYRITDYVTTSTQADSRSVGHQFDVIVRADDVDVLNENAYAIHHKGDTYFQNCNLSNWKLKYSLENDADTYAWADTVNGKGVIYYMKDEYNNECCYDFKNIQYKRWKITPADDTLMEYKDELENYYVGVGAMIGVKKLDENDFKWFYTFNGSDTEELDASVNGGAQRNIIKSYNSTLLKQVLNNIAFISNPIDNNSILQNTIDYGSNNITLLGISYLSDNHFGQSSNNVILLSNAVIHNRFVCNCDQCFIYSPFTVEMNTFGGYFQKNILTAASGISTNTIYDSVHENIFIVKQAIYSNTIYYNSFKNNIKCQTGNMSYNVIQTSFQNNNIICSEFNLNNISQGFTKNEIYSTKTFSNNIIDSSFANNTINVQNGFTQNHISYAFKYNTINGYRFINNDIAPYCMYNKFAEFTGNVVGPAFSYNAFKMSNNINDADRSLVKACKFGPYVLYNNFYSTQTDSSANGIFNLNVQGNLQGTSSNYNHIEVPVASTSEITISRNSNGEIKVYNMADLIN